MLKCNISPGYLGGPEVLITMILSEKQKDTESEHWGVCVLALTIFVLHPWTKDDFSDSHFLLLKNKKTEAISTA